MPSEYDIFERTSAGYLVWRDVVSGYEKAARRLSELGSQSDNEHFLFHLASKQVVARVNESPHPSDSRLAPNADGEADILNRLKPFGTQSDDSESAATACDWESIT